MSVLAAVVKLNSLIFVMGGVSFNANLSSVECYNPQLDSWTEMPSLKYCKGQVAGTVLNGCIYVIGGGDDFLREGLKTVEKYNPFTHEWEVVSPMRMGRGALGMYRVLNGQNLISPFEIHTLLARHVMRIQSKIPCAITCMSGKLQIYNLLYVMQLLFSICFRRFVYI